MITDCKMLKAVRSLQFLSNPHKTLYSAYKDLYPSDLNTVEDYARLYAKKVSLIFEKMLAEDPEKEFLSLRLTEKGKTFLSEIKYDDAKEKAE